MEWTRGPIIGRGSTATVSLAISTSSGELFALKSSELSNSTFLQKEQFFLSKLFPCPYIVGYLGYDITNENGRSMYNIFIEYAPGGTLSDAIFRHGGRIDEPVIRSYTRNILHGLDYLHRNVGLVHCDIKSKNVLISKEGEAKIADFGCAKLVAGDTSGFSGTPAFMSPEVARGEEQGFAADIWAVGCTIIEMASGKIPWLEKNDDPLSVLFTIGFSDEVPGIPGLLSETGQDFLSKCLQRDPTQRWTAKELLDHPFLCDLELDLEKPDNDQICMSFSPSCVLDQDFWNSVDTPQDLTLESILNPSSNNSAADDRIKKLIGFNSVNFPDWSLEEDWITVRRIGEIDEEDVIMVENSSIPGELLGLDSIHDEPEPGNSIFHENLLLEFFVEIEGYDIAIKNLEFLTDNKKIFFDSNLVYLWFFLSFLGNIF